ncbi:MAG: hypothetical protein KKH94_08365 [Candidatus Omnitrophica bacterium]|nr:hypothetical protein [Candidatus Omnitrophota bacterium]
MRHIKKVGIVGCLSLMLLVSTVDASVVHCSMGPLRTPQWRKGHYVPHLIKSLRRRNNKRIVIAHGITRYYYEDIFYSPNIVYAVVPQSIEAAEKTIMVNVPNANGSFTRIVLKKTKEGYLGPQGEFYLDYPTIHQLKAMYAK